MCRLPPTGLALAISRHNVAQASLVYVVLLVVCDIDDSCLSSLSQLTFALPLITAYSLAKHAPRERKRLYDKRGALMERLLGEYESSSRR